MGKPATLLEGLCGHALSLGAQSIEVEYKDSRECVFAHVGGAGIRIANYASSSSDAKELRGNLYAAAKKSVRTVIGGQAYILKVRVFDSFGEDAFEVSIEPAPKLDPSIAPSFTASRVNIWPSSITTPRSTARPPPSRTWSATSGFPHPRFTI